MSFAHIFALKNPNFTPIIHSSIESFKMDVLRISINNYLVDSSYQVIL